MNNLERCVRENKELYAYYPAFDETDISGMELVGDIYDGVLYIK